MGEDRPSNRREPREVLFEPPARRRDPTRRSALIAGAIGLVVIVLLASVQCGGSVTAPSPATPTATGISPLVAEQMTATAVAAEFPVLARRPLHLPTLTKGAPCPLVPAQRLSFAAFGPALGQGPVYAAGFNLDGTLDAASPAQFGGGISGWGGMKIVWNIAPGDAGPAVVRGQRWCGASRSMVPTRCASMAARIRQITRGTGLSRHCCPSCVSFGRIRRVTRAPMCVCKRLAVTRCRSMA